VSNAGVGKIFHVERAGKIWRDAGGVFLKGRTNVLRIDVLKPAGPSILRALDISAIIYTMKILFWEVKKAPRSIKPDLVNDVSSIVDGKLGEVWDAIASIRTDLSTAHKLAQATQRQLYRKIGKENGDTDPDADLLKLIPGQPDKRVFRTGDTI